MILGNIGLNQGKQVSSEVLRGFALLTWEQHSAFVKHIPRASGKTRVFEKFFGNICPHIIVVSSWRSLQYPQNMRCYLYHLDSVFYIVAFCQNHLGCLVNVKIPGLHHRLLELESLEFGHSFTRTQGDSCAFRRMTTLKMFSDPQCLMNMANSISSTRLLAHWFNEKWFTIVCILFYIC